MAQSDILRREYYATPLNQIIHCPFQPGNLKISTGACLKRHKAAQTKKLEIFSVDDQFKYFISQGLLRCEKCPIIIDKKVHNIDLSVTEAECGG